MILDYINNIYRYKGINGNLDLAIDFLLSHPVNEICGNVCIRNNEVCIKKQEVVLETLDKRAWENHFHYTDIHVAVSGSETLCFMNDTDSIGTWSQINEEEDYELSYDTTTGNSIYLKPGMFAILWPGEPHKPNIGEGGYTKVIVKVKVN